MSKAMPACAVTKTPMASDRAASVLCKVSLSGFLDYITWSNVTDIVSLPGTLEVLKRPQQAEGEGSS
jgi:hypothetical protein